MAAQILDGKLVATAIKDQVKKDVDEIIKAGGEPPRLTVIIVGEDPASQVYVRNKHKTCAELGIESEVIQLPADVSERDLEKQIAWLNCDQGVNGILVQMPLPKHIDANKIIDAIDPKKDVDGFHPINVGNMHIGKDALLPCTPHGVMKMLEFYNINLAGKKAVVMGRSNIVGKPMAALLQAANATVTVCHTKTKDVTEHCKTADIIVVATGKPNSLTADMLQFINETVVIDVGINRIDGKLCGDADFESVKEVAGAITPVPGGVGPLTIAMLMKNTVEAYKQQNR